MGSALVSGSAFSQARYKILPDFFEALVHLTKATYIDSPRNLWKGHSLIAGDGSTLNLPSSRDIADHFGSFYQTDYGIKRYLGRVFLCYDVLNDFVVDGQLTPITTGEKTLMLSALARLPDPNSVILLDRGFGHFCTIKALLDGQRKFCVRLPTDNSSFAKKMMEQGGNDIHTV